jgi:hypothetical protein
VIPAYFTSLRFETKNLMIFIQKPNDNVLDGVESEVRSANEHFFRAIPAARCYFPDEIERIDGGNEGETLRKIFSPSALVSLYFRSKFVEMRRTVKDAGRISSLCSRQEFLFPSIFHDRADFTGTLLPIR